MTHLLDVHRYGEAEAEARSLLGAEPESARAHRLLAAALRGQGRTAEALEQATEACRLDPEDVDSLIVLADCAAAAGNHRLAVETARRAVALHPHSWATHYTLGHALLDAPGLYYSGASEAIDAAERLAPASADVQNLRGMYLTNLGDRRGARAAYRRALQLDPHSSLALNNLASLDVRRRPGRSARLLTSAATLDPQRRLIQDNLTVVTWNILVYFYRALFWSGFVVAMSRGFGVALWVRVAILACVAIGLAWWASRRLRNLPRGYRQSPSAVWRSFSRHQRVAAVGLVVALLLMLVVAFAPPSVAGFAWLAIFALGLVMRMFNKPG